MGMMLRRHKIKTPTSEGTRKTPVTATQSSPPPITKKVPEVDYRDLSYQDLKRYAKGKGVDINIYRSKNDIFEQLELLG